MNSFDENREAVTDASSMAPSGVVGPPGASAPAAQTDPAWNGWDVLRILLMAAIALIAAVFVLLLVVPGTTLRQRTISLNALPELQIIGQMAAYLGLLGYMYVLVTKERRRPRFWEALHWNWPQATQWYLFGGFILQAAFLIVELLLKRFLPKAMPFDALLRRPYSIMLIAAFSTTLGPLMEELFFRGFLYPVLKRHFGVLVGVFVTALGFALMHAAQYGYSWLSISLIFIVGVVLALVRDRKNSVAAGFLVHVGYNGTIMMMLFIATDGFRHLEKLGSQ